MINILQDITKNFSSLFSSKKGGSVIGVDIGSSSIKIVQLKNDNGVAVLETYGSVSLGTYVENSYIGQAVNPTHDQTIQAIKDILKEANITSLNSAVAIPSASSLVFLLELPKAVTQKDLATIIPTEARRFIPVPISEVSLDWWMIPEDDVLEGNDDAPAEILGNKNNKRKVLVAAIHNEALARFQQVVKDAQFNADFFEIEMFSNVRSCVGSKRETVALVDFGASKTKVSVVSRGVIQDFHIINRGSQDITRVLSTGLNISLSKAEEFKKKFGMAPNDEYSDAESIIRGSLEYVMSEINAIILAYEKKYGQSIDSVMVTGGGASLIGLVEYMQQKLPASVIKSNPFSQVKVPVFLESVLEEIGSDFGVAIGLALRKLSS